MQFFWLESFSEFVVLKIECLVTTVRCLVAVHAVELKGLVPLNCTHHEMQNTRSGRKSGQMSWRRWVIDKDFQNQIDNGKVFTCEKHFEPDDMRHVSAWVVCNKHIWYPCKHDWPHKWCLIRVWTLYSYTDCCYTSLFFYFYFNSIGKDGQKNTKVWSLANFQYA